MPSHAVEPGTRLVDRYRLEEHLGEAEGTTYWRALDELLDRQVGVCLLPATHRHADEVLRAARRAAALADARFLRVLDASDVDGVVYVVSEWVSATNLVELLADGPLSAGEARDLGAQIADALDAAGQAGLAHLCLEPEHVLRTAHGQVKLAGLAVDAAARGLSGPDRAEAALLDTRGAAAVTYAALTARWPQAGSTGLPPAPRDGDDLCSPRQVRAGIPHDLDEVVCRALGLPGHHGSALATPAELAAALEDAHVTSRVPVVRQEAGRGGSDGPYQAALLPPYDDAPPRRGRTTLLAWTAVALVLVVGLGLALSQVIGALGGGPGPSDAGAATSQPSPSASAGSGRVLRVRDITSFDPPPQGNGDENGDRAALAVDGKKSTVWTTKDYKDPFGPSGIKDGVGLLLDLGATKRVGSVSIQVAGGPTDVEVRSSDTAGSALSDFRPVPGASARGIDGPPAVLRPGQPVQARYLLVWLTSVPFDGSVYRGQVAEIVVRD